MDGTQTEKKAYQSLLMYWKRRPVEEIPFPEGVVCRPFNGTREDVRSWVVVCRHGLLEPEEDERSFQSRMLDFTDLQPDHILMVEQGGQIVGTITAVIHPGSRMGYIHMVAADPKVRGRGIGNAMMSAAMWLIWEEGCIGATLNTDDFRLPAICSYLRAGFLPVDYAPDMSGRWEAILKRLDIRTLDMVDEKGNRTKTLRKEG